MSQEQTEQHPETSGPLTRRTVLQFAAALGLLAACQPIRAPETAALSDHFQIGDLLVSKTALTLTAEAGGAAVVGQVRPGFAVVVLAGPVASSGANQWRVGVIGADGAPLTGWTAAVDATGAPLVDYAVLPGAQTPLNLPFANSYPLTQLYGENPAFYQSITLGETSLLGNPLLNFGLPVGVDVLAVDDGEVVLVDPQATSQFGNFVRIQHAWGESIYTNVGAILLGEGEPVRRGQVIAQSGASGPSGTPFLGFGIRVNPFDRNDGWGGLVDPLPYLAPAAVALPAYLTGRPPTATQAVMPAPAAPAAVIGGGGGAYVIFDLCIRDGACAEVCPVECIIPGHPVSEWPWYYVDPDTCIACGACVPECPVGAVLPMEEVPAAYSDAIELNALFFSDGPGYEALNMAG